MGGSFKKVHAHGRIGLAGATTSKRATMIKRDDCTGTNFYTAPTANQTLDSSKEVTFSWNNKCLNPSPEYVDIYLYAYGKNDSMIQAFDSAKYSEGHLKTNLDPNWWGLDQSVQLQLQIVQHGAPHWEGTVGPVWTATYDSSKGVPPKPSGGDPSIAQRVKNIIHELPGGSIAAAVLIPLLFVAGVVAFFYIRRARRKTEAKTNRFSKAVDQRMSTISTDWRSISGAGANAAVRNSMAVRGSVIDGGERPVSIFANNQAGIGALRTSEEKVPQMDEMRRARQSVFTNGERNSRISFAPDVRTSYAEKENPRLPSAVRGLNVRSFHQGHSFEEERYDEQDRDLAMSPTQAAGPPLLHPGEIAARASSENDRDFQREVLQMPAMTLMRTGGASDSEMVLPATTVTPPTNSAYASAMPTVPTPALQPHTPMNGSMSTPTGPVLSPDALLRAYAAGRPLASPTPSTPTVSSNGGMRILYQNEPAALAAPQYPQIHQYPATPSIATSATLAPSDNNPFRKSMAEGDAVRASAYSESMYSAGAYDAYDDEDAYDTAHHHVAHEDTTHSGYGQAK